MRKSCTALLGLVSIITSVVANQAWAQDENKQTNAFNAYVRTNFQTGRGGLAGERIDETGGFAIHGRLLEGQYFELSAKTAWADTSWFRFTVAQGGESFAYTNVWPETAGYAIRDLFYQIDHLPGNPKLQAWFGSRMYRGDNDIHLFDTWALDNQNLLGGGIAYCGDTTVEFALGARRGSTYALATGVATDSLAPGTQRYMLINKVIVPHRDRKIKTNLELHYIPTANTTATINGAPTPLNIPSVTGIMAGFQYPLWNGANGFFNYGHGDVMGGIDAPFAAVPTQPGLISREGSNAAHLALGGVNEFPSNFGVLYAAMLRASKPRDTDMGTSFSAAVRGLYNISNHLRPGVEVDVVQYLKKMTLGKDVNFVQISPLVEYGLGKGMFGVPRLKLIASNIFYSEPVAHYGVTSQYAFTVSTGLELWF
ncbi:MAG TPA: carbohydrate porin [Bdellovibrionota bacterium]|nr:carbohydrate porin [Bdellovibrionota bacterium]